MSFYDVLLSQYLNGNGGGSTTVDTQMSDTSTNPVQNKVIKEYVDGKTADTRPTLTITITYDSDNDTLTCDKTHQDIIDFINNDTSSSYDDSNCPKINLHEIDISDGETDEWITENVWYGYLSQTGQGGGDKGIFISSVNFNRAFGKFRALTSSISGDFIELSGLEIMLNGYAILNDDTVKSLSSFAFPI